MQSPSRCGSLYMWGTFLQTIEKALRRFEHALELRKNHFKVKQRARERKNKWLESKK